MPRHRWLVPALVLAIAGLAPTPSFADLSLTVAEYDSPEFSDTSSFTLYGITSSSPASINLTPGVAQDVPLDLSQLFSIGFGIPGDTFTGTATGDITLGGMTQSISYGYTYNTTNPRSISLTLTGKSAVVFDFGTYEVTVTPIDSTNGLRKASFLETPLSSAVPEPSTMWIAALGGAAFAGYGWRRARRSRAERA
jgi:hypothetical protein